MNSWRDGRVKMYVTHRGLTLRKDYPPSSGRGTYDPLPAGASAPSTWWPWPAAPTPTPWSSWYLA